MNKKHEIGKNYQLFLLQKNIRTLEELSKHNTILLQITWLLSYIYVS